MRVARIDYHTTQPRPDQPAVEIGCEVPRHELDFEDEIAYLKKHERPTSVELLPATFPVLASARLTFAEGSDLIVVMRDCGSY
jgi:hypothetical protein